MPGRASRARATCRSARAKASLSRRARDSAARLDGRCRYRVEPIAPPARWWTLTLYDRRRRARRQSGQPLRLHQRARWCAGATARLSVVIGSEPSPATGCRAPRRRSRSSCRLYDTPVSTGLAHRGNRQPACDRRWRAARDPPRAVGDRGLLLGLLVHSLTLLALPSLATRGATSGSKSSAREAGFQLLPQPTPSESLLPLPDPSLRSRPAATTSRAGPVHVRAPLDRRLLSPCPSTPPDGLNFYALTDRAAPERRDRADALYQPAARRGALARGSRHAGGLRVEAPGPDGLVVVRALAPEPGYVPAAAKGDRPGRAAPRRAMPAPADAPGPGAAMRPTARPIP